MAAEELENFLKDLESISDSIQGLMTSLDGKVIVEKSKVIDSAIPLKTDRLSPDRESALKEAKYLNARKGGELSEEHIGRISRDFLEKNSGGFVQIDPEGF